MKEMIITAGRNKAEICWLRYYLRNYGYKSISCNSAEELTRELEILCSCDVEALVVVEAGILKDISDDLIGQLGKCAPEIPFLLFEEPSLKADLAETFENICEHRKEFRAEQNSELASVFRETGVKVMCS